MIGENEEQTQASGQEDILSEDDFSSVAMNDYVSRMAYQRVLDQRKKDLSSKRQLEEKLLLLQQKEQEKQEEELRKKGELEKIIGEREKKIQELLNEKQRFQESLQVELKRQAFLDALPGKLSDREYEKFIPLDEIRFTDDGELDEIEVKKLADRWSKKHFRLLKEEKGSAKIPNEAAEKSSGLTYEAWLKLPTKEKAARIKDVIK